MTKNERTALQKFMNKFEEIRKEQNEIFHRLQKANKETTGTAWCSAEENYKDLEKAGIEWAKDEYKRYIELDGKMELIQEYGQMLCGINFWKD